MKTYPELAYAFVRLALGLNIFLHGFVRWRAGRHSFSQVLVNDFAKTELSPTLVAAFGLVLPIAETAIGGLLILGLFTLPALVAGLVLLTALVAGKCLQADWPTASSQLIYVVIYAALLWLADANRYALDSLLTLY